MDYEDVGETLIGAEAMQSFPFLGRLRKALDKTGPTTAAQSAAATHSTTKRLKTGKSSKAKDTNDEDDEVDLQLDDDDYDVIIQNQQQDVEAGPASQNPSTKDGSKKQSKHTRGAKRCAFEKTRPWNVTPSGVDSDWTAKLVVYMKSMGDDPCAKAPDALQQTLLSVFSLDGVRHASELAKSLRESQDLVSTILLGIIPPEASSPHQILGHAIQNLLVAEVHTIFGQAQLFKEYLSTAHLLQTQIQFLHQRHESLYPSYEAAYTVSMRKKDTTPSFRAFLVESAVGHLYGTSTTARATVEKSLRIGEVLFWLQRAFGVGIVGLVGGDWKKLGFEAWSERTPGILDHAAKASPSLCQVCKLAEDNVWAHPVNEKGNTIPTRSQREPLGQRHILGFL